ncbi:MAG: Smr/MutS family protein [Myxococcota bacterium]|nr:Smr/MutS family protein [Myxococcota bacterium]
MSTEESAEMRLGIDQRTLNTLDWDAVLVALAEHARTLQGAAAARTPDFAPDRAAVMFRYAAVAEVFRLEDTPDGSIPIGGVSDISAPLEGACSGRLLEAGELKSIASSLAAIRRLRRWLDARHAEAPTLRQIIDPVDIDAELLDTLERSFDDAGQLSEALYPQLADLRHRITTLTGRIHSVLNNLIGSSAMSSMLQDRYITERAGRYVVPVKQNYKRSIGVVHGTSQSGETVFVEPLEVIAHTNELKEAQAALSREIRRILAALTAAVGAEADNILTAMECAIRIDLTVARAGLAHTLRASIPAVGTDGTLRLDAARHPVLQLRGVDVIGNDLSMTDTHPGLVLTGPNAGGKTVALKTFGLCALMVRAGIPLPAGPDSRADFFAHISADIGDLQTVEGDLSTFSGHLESLKRVIAAAGRDSLVLLDEAGMGTDPAQGAALAQAVVQSLADTGARVAVTTHYSQLKALPSSDARFRVGAVRFIAGQPTYQLDLGLAGESHAFAIARRLAFPGAVLDRARDLLDEGERRMDELVTELESERGRARQLREDLEAQRSALDMKSRILEHKEQQLEKRKKHLESEIAATFRKRLAKREDEVKALIAALQSNPDIKLAGRSLEQIRKLRALPKVPETAPAAPPPADLKVGDKVKLRTLGSRGKIVAVLPRDRFEVEVGRMRMKVRLQDLAEGEPLLAHRKSAKAANIEASLPPPVNRELVAVRTDANTCDLRGKRVDAALDTAEQFLDAMVRRNEPVTYILHGHGTGVLKKAIRDWLPECAHVNRWRPAMQQEGGDAFTLIELV